MWSSTGSEWGTGGGAWVTQRREEAEAGKSARTAETSEPGHSGSPLVVFAVKAWAGEWPSVKAAVAQWVAGLSARYQYLPWMSGRRLAALLCKARDAGELAHLAEAIRAAADRPCWQPWAEALEATLSGRDATGLSEKAAELHELLSQPSLPGSS